MGGQTGSEKRSAWWNQEAKEAIRRKKTAFRAWLTNKSSEQLRLLYYVACKIAAKIVKQSKEKPWEVFGQKLDTDYRSANKVFWKTIHHLRGKRTPVATFIENANSVLLKQQKEILNRWRKYFCDLLNPVTVQHLENPRKKLVKKVI